MPIKRQFRGEDRGGKDSSSTSRGERRNFGRGGIFAVLIAVVISEHQRKWTRKMEKQLKEKLKHLEDRHKAERNAVVRLAEPATDEFPVYAKSDPPAAIGPLPRESNPARTCTGDGAGNA